ncbi:MAG: hypothetical protein ACREK8_02940 [Gemmatimonadales bacterium]
MRRPIRRVAFYRFALAAPLLVPAALWILLWLTDMSLPSPIGLVAALLFSSVWIAGVPYALFAIVVGVWIGRCQEADLRALSMRMPLFFLPVLGVWLAVQTLPTGGRFQPGGLLTAVLSLGGCVLLIGYLYVGLVDLVQSFADDRGWFRRPPRSVDS